MPPRAKRSRKTATKSDMTEVPPRQAIAGLDADKLAATIVTAVRSAMSSNVRETRTRKRDAGVVDDIVDDDVQDITGAGTKGGARMEPNAPVFNSITVPLGSRINAKIKAKIWGEEYIDFGALLDPSPNPEKFSISFAQSSGADSGKNKPELTLEPVQTSKKISSIGQWVSAFHAFVAIYCVKFPGETPKLMKFGETVRDIAWRGGDWSYYDEQFRFLRQSSPTTYEWDVVHWELWHRAVTFRPKSAAPQSDKSFAKPKGKQPFPKGTCWSFNAGKFCAGCRFEHKCYKCGGKHSGAQCTSAANVQSSGDRTTVFGSGSKQSANYSSKGGNS